MEIKNTLTFRMPEKLYEELYDYSVQSGIPIGQLIVIALWEKFNWNMQTSTESEND